MLQLNNQSLLILCLGMVLEACASWRRLPEIPTADFDLVGKIQADELYLAAEKQSQLILQIIPKNEVAKKASYRIVNWQIVDGRQGQLLDDQLTPINQDSKLTSGENSLYYLPLQEGTHQLKLAITDEYNDLKRELVLSPISVKDKQQIPFQLTLQADSKSLYAHQKAVLTLALAAELPDAADLTYEIEEMTFSPGTLYWQDTGAAVAVGNPLKLGSHPLIFKPADQLESEALSIPIQLTVSNSSGSRCKASIVLEVKPIGCKIHSWLREATAVEQKLIEGPFGVLEVMLSEVDQELATATWKIASWEF